MLDITWKYCLCIFTFVFMTGYSDLRTVATHGDLLDGSSSQIGLDNSQETVKFLLSQSVSQKGIQIEDYWSQNEDKGGISRRKRNVLFPSGIKLCAQETVKQAIANHLDYFHLRVCQETVWEAFKIFWDRLPERNEYQDWMSMCREGGASTLDIGTNFSKSSEHVALVHNRMPLTGLNSEASNSWLHMCSLQTTAAPSEPDAATTQKEEMTLWPETFTVWPTPEATREVIEVPAQGITVEEEATTSHEVTMGAVHEVTLGVTPQTTAARMMAGQDTADKVEEDMITNEIEADILTRQSWSVKEQMVELTIQLKGEIYTDALKDPFSFYYQRLAQQFIEKIEDAFERLPGFKSVAVLEFRPQRDAKGGRAVVVHCAVTLEVDGGISKETLDYINLQSNLVGNSYTELDERPTVVYTITDFRNYITEALHKENFIGNTTLAVDPNTLQLENVESLVPESSNTSNSADDMDNILAAEKLVNLPGRDLNNNDIFNSGFSKDDFLVDPIHSYDPWMGLQDMVASENDVIVLDESPTLPPPVFSDRTLGVNLESTPISGNAHSVPSDDNNGDLEEEGLIYGNSIVVTKTTPTDSPERGNIAIEITPGAVITDIASPTPGGQDEKSALYLFDTGSGSGLAGEEFGPMLPVASDGGVEWMEDRMEEGESEKHQTGEELLVDLAVHAAAGVAPTLSTHVLEASGRHDDVHEWEPSIAIMLVTTTATPIMEVEEGVVPLVTEGPSVEISEEEWANDEILMPNEQGDQDGKTHAPTVIDLNHSFDVPYYGGPGSIEGDSSSEYPSGIAHGTDMASVANPNNRIPLGQALMVFFSLRVTNMMFSEDLFNKSSPEYKALEQRFLELLVPYLQSNLSNFQNLEILNFRNGSIVVNSRMKFGKPVPHGVNNAVYLILEDFCNAAYQTMNLAIDKYSLDVESGEQADPCKFQACNEFSECTVNRWSGEAECVCNAGYFSVDGLPCQSVCDLRQDFCMNDGKCDIIPGQGAICRCRVGENWWYRGEHCEEYVSEPLVVGIAIASVAGFLLVASGVIFFLARTLRDQYDKDETEDPVRRGDSMPSLERATKYNPMYESDITTGYSHYYRRYPEMPCYSSASAEASTDFSSEEIRHIYENNELTREEIQDRIRIIELYAKDRQFADFIRQHQVCQMLNRFQEFLRNGVEGFE